MIYLDNAAATPCDDLVLEAMMPYYKSIFANSSNISNQMGMDAHIAVQQARNKVASNFGCLAQQMVWTAGATESNNLAIQGTVKYFRETNPGKIPHLVTSSIEHKSIIVQFTELAEQGCEVTFVPPDETGRTEAAKIMAAIKDNTLLVSIMMANNELGVINELEAIGKITRENKIIFHTDATQYAGKFGIDLELLPVDLLSFSSHKMYGPKGIGGLFIRDNSRIQPLFWGGGQENGLRPGTLNVPAIVGCSKAIEICSTQFNDQMRIQSLRDELEQKLMTWNSDIIINGYNIDRLPNISNITFPLKQGYNLLNMVKEQGILACSSGSACDSADNTPSHVMKALGKTWHQAKNTLRFSLGRFTTPEEIETTVRHLTGVIKSAMLI